MTTVILDTETTSTDADLEVIELAWLEFGHLPNHPVNAAQHVTRSFCQRYLPERPITFGAQATHHILLSELLECPPSSQAASDLPAHVEYIIGHNVDFDWKALGCPDVRRICTLAMCRSIWPECDSHSLSAMTYFLFGSTPDVRKTLREAHSAAADVTLCGSILRKILEHTGINEIETLWEFSEFARLPVTMTFGKHKGELIADVPYGYVKWYRGQADTDPYLLEAFRRAGK